jgi:hypothetical protein
VRLYRNKAVREKDRELYQQNGNTSQQNRTQLQTFVTQQAAAHIQLFLKPTVT